MISPGASSTPVLDEPIGTVMRLSLPATGIPPISPGERALLTDALRDGHRVFWSRATQVSHGLPGLDRARAFLFRRWVLESLLVLEIQGPSSYNSLSLALGKPAGESLAPKLEALRAAHLVSRSVTAPSPLRVQYALTPTGEQLGSGVYLLTRWKGLHALAVTNPSSEMPELERLGRRVTVSPAGERAALDRYLETTQTFAKTREAYCRPKEFEGALAMTRRFCRFWVHKWHGRVLLTLALGGPQRFADLRRSLGIGDQALAVALAGLQEVGSIKPSLERGDKRYEVAAFGWSDLALSAPLALLVQEASGPKETAGDPSP